MTGAVITANGKYELDIKSNLMDLYANNSNIVLYISSWEGAKDALGSVINNTIVEALKSTGMFDETVLTDAAKNVKSDYEKAGAGNGNDKHKINKKEMGVTGDMTMYSVNLRDLIDDIIAKYKQQKGIS